MADPRPDVHLVGHEARFGSCRETFTPGGPGDLEHAVRDNGQPCGGPWDHLGRSGSAAPDGPASVIADQPGLVWVVITVAADQLADVELLDARPRWDGTELPAGTVQLVRAGYVNGGDTSVEFVIVGTQRQ